LSGEGGPAFGVGLGVGDGVGLGVGVGLGGSADSPPHAVTNRTENSSDAARREVRMEDSEEWNDGRSESTGDPAIR
jgi:hypothetical protein